MGKADEPYARSVQQTHALPTNMLPDAGLVFDTLLKREKVWAPRSSRTLHPQLKDMVSVRQAPGRTFQLHVFIRGACHPYVNFISFFRPCQPVLIHVSKSVFRTSHKDVSINETSSYVDLAPLYGNNVETLNKIRAGDGRGLLLPDTFAEDRLLLLPPAVCVLLVLFSRNHNVRFGFCNGVSSIIDHRG
jgi:hypothetical protein